MLVSTSSSVTLPGWNWVRFHIKHETYLLMRHLFYIFNFLYSVNICITSVLPTVKLNRVKKLCIKLSAFINLNCKKYKNMLFLLALYLKIPLIQYLFLDNLLLLNWTDECMLVIVWIFHLLSIVLPVLNGSITLVPYPFPF